MTDIEDRPVHAASTTTDSPSRATPLDRGRLLAAKPAYSTRHIDWTGPPV